MTTRTRLRGRFFGLFAGLTAALLVLGACSDDGDDGEGGGGSEVADSGADTGGSADSGADAGVDTSQPCPDLKADQLPATVGGERPAKVVMPGKWDGCTRHPLVILLHGYTANSLVQDIYLGLSANAAKHGFVLLLPNATKSSKGNPFWNATETCCDFEHQNPDDVGYIRGLILEATAKLPVDPARVYLVGHSNGGFMSFRMACDEAELITGIASLAGSVTPTASACKPAKPVHVLQIHGTKDATVKYEGGKLSWNKVSYPSAEDTVKRWRGLNGCPEGAQPDSKADFDSSVAGEETTIRSWTGCKDGTSATLWKMQDAGHVPGINAAFKTALLEHVLAWRR